MADTEKTHGPKKKRKRSFLQRQKQYGKKGRFGKGVELSEEMYQYFLRILEVMNQSKDKPEDLEILAGNVIDEMSGVEVESCSNQLASRAVERLIEFAPDEKLIALTGVFGKEFRLVFTDAFCSHVLQSMIVTLASRLLPPAAGSKQAEREDAVTDELQSAFLRIAKFGLNNLEDFIFDTYANHILRTIFACLNGCPVKIEQVKDYGSQSEPKPVPVEFTELATSFVQQICKWPQFNDLTTQAMPSGCLQALVLSVRRNPKLSKKVVKKIQETVDTYSGLDLSEEKHQPLLHLIEAAVSASSLKEYKAFYDSLFKGKLSNFALSKRLNFAVQKLLLHCPTKEAFEEIFDELEQMIPRLLVDNYTGVLYALAKACRQHKAKQGEFSRGLLYALDCNVPQSRQVSTLPVLCCLCKFEKYDPDTSKMHLHGSLIAQEMLNFTKPIRLVSSLLQMEPSRLVALFSDPCGCHVADAFVRSEFVGEKSREKLYKKLLGQYATLAASKHGSRAVDAILSFLDVQQKTQVMQELKSQQSSVVATQSGRIIASKTRLDLFRQDKDSWVKQAQRGSKNGDKQKKKKKKKENEEEEEKKENGDKQKKNEKKRKIPKFVRSGIGSHPSRQGQSDEAGQ